MRLLSLGLLVPLVCLSLGGTARAFTDADLLDGFERAVFGSEYASFGWQSHIVKKFTGPVRVYVDDRSAVSRARDVGAFLRTLPSLVHGLDLTEVFDPAVANFHVYVVDRSDYQNIIHNEIYRRSNAGPAPGRCIVRIVSTFSGISRSDAVIVADESEFLFRRCMVEEILQGLGPVNDDPALVESVFNDRSQHDSVTDFDRYIMNMLYDPLVLPGMTRLQARRVLPAALADVRARLQ